jgi:hypothetical protein
MDYPCPCGGKVKWKKDKVVVEGVDCGVLAVEVCDKCGEEYLPEESMAVVEKKLKQRNLWGVKRKEVKFWPSGNTVTLRIPTEVSRRLHLTQVKKGYLTEEGDNKIVIEY